MLVVDIKRLACNASNTMSEDCNWDCTWAYMIAIAQTADSQVASLTWRSTFSSVSSRSSLCLRLLHSDLMSRLSAIEVNYHVFSLSRALGDLISLFCLVTYSAPSDLLLDVVRLINVLTYLLTYLPFDAAYQLHLCVLCSECHRVCVCPLIEKIL